jgi:hypothetical protein
VPRLGDEVRYWLSRGTANVRVPGRRGLYVTADPTFTDSSDEAVFGAVLAKQMVDGEPWLIRGVFRTDSSGRTPVLARVVVEHFTDPDREVTGTVIREINFGAIRDAGLVKIRQRAEARSMFRGPFRDSPEDLATMARAAREAARSRVARGAYSAEHYHNVARNLFRLQSETRSWLPALADFYSKQLGDEVHPERVRGWIKTATKLGFIAPGKRGKPRREPGPKYKEEPNDGS